MTSPGALDTAAATVREHARALAGESWETVDGPGAVTAVEEIAAARSFLDAALLRGITRIEDTDAVAALGWASVKDFLTHLTGGHKGTGGGLVRAATQLRDLPTIQTALEEGHLTLPQARAIAGKVTTLPRVPEFREAVAAGMLDLATTQHLDASGLDAAFDDLVRTLDPAGEIIATDKERARAERGAHNARFLSFAPDTHGGIRVKGYGTPEDVERIKTVLLPLTTPVVTEPGACGGHRREPDQPTFDTNGIATRRPCPDPHCHHDGRDPREHGTRLWDALVETCERLHATDTLPRDHGTPVRMIVTIDHHTLTQQLTQLAEAGIPSQADAANTGQAGVTATGAALSAGTVRRLACDAEILPIVLGTDSQVLDVGRTQRLVTPTLWTALIARDQHCAFPGCTRMPLACDAHHITHWADGGPTNLDNLIMLCRRHHTAVHHTPWTVHIDPHTHQPAWTNPPPLTITKIRERMSYHPARPPSDPPPAPHAA